MTIAVIVSKKKSNYKQYYNRVNTMNLIIKQLKMIIG